MSKYGEIKNGKPGQDDLEQDNTEEENSIADEEELDLADNEQGNKQTDKSKANPDKWNVSTLLQQHPYCILSVALACGMVLGHCMKSKSRWM